jgi:Zn-dependent peptidase ImmA (M78 family)
MSFVHPGKRYIEINGPIQSTKDVLEFANFLLVESGLEGALPVDLNIVFSHFGIPKPKYVPLPDQQGLLVDADRGIIVINSTDPNTRQRFSEAHELAEMLFSELPAGIDLGDGWFLKRPGGYKESTKEYLCNRVAANLLMPPKELRFHLDRYGVTFDGAKIVSADCQVSLSAALIQLTHLGPGRYSVVLWRMKNKPKEIKNQIPSSQLKLFDIASDGLPPKKLRVEWSMRVMDGPFIPLNKSTESTSLIYAAWKSGIFNSGVELMTFDNRHIHRYRCENLPFKYKGEIVVLSLVEQLHS